LSTAALQEIDEKLTHEFIHIYDVRSLHLNLLQCKDLAYSEIRAAREATTPSPITVPTPWSLLSTTMTSNSSSCGSSGRSGSKINNNIQASTANIVFVPGQPRQHKIYCIRFVPNDVYNMYLHRPWQIIDPTTTTVTTSTR
jgi:Peptidase M76 family